MKHPKLALTFFVILFLIIFAKYQSDKTKKAENDKLLSNNIEFTGKIKSITISNNHCFAIILVDILQANVDSFNSDLKDQFFPYAIKNGQAEIYTTICNETKPSIGTIIKLNSDRRKLILEKNKKMTETEIYLSSEKPNIKFIKENTKLK